MKNCDLLIASVNLRDVSMIRNLVKEMNHYCPKECPEGAQNCLACETEWLDLEHENKA